LLEARRLAHLLAKDINVLRWVLIYLIQVIFLVAAALLHLVHPLDHHLLHLDRDIIDHHASFLPQQILTNLLQLFLAHLQQ
jgi:hypothetical protein